MEDIEIDYLFNCDMVAFKITSRNSFGQIDGVYKSPFLFDNTYNAYDAAIIELSKNG